MDPDECLARIRKMANEAANDTEDSWTAIHSAALAEHILSLDNWLKNGGFLPKDWQR